jgi:hypothetical protein
VKHASPVRSNSREKSLSPIKADMKVSESPVRSTSPDRKRSAESPSSPTKRQKTENDKGLVVLNIRSSST